MVSFVALALVGAAAFAIYVVVQRRRQQEIARAKALAATHGFEIDVGPKNPPTLAFDVFEVGHSKQVSFQMWRRGERDTVFGYQYTTGSGKNSQTHRRTCALISLPFDAAHTKIGPEGFWSGVGRVLGIRDIEVESAPFNSQYRITSDDERFAVTLLDQPMIAWLLSAESGAGQIKFELFGPWLLCVADRMEIDRQFGYLDWAQAIRGHMPTVLSSLYPVR